MSSDPPPAAPPPGRDRRLHPSSLIFLVLRHAKGLLLPAILFVFFTRGDRWELWFGLFVVPVMLFEGYRYFRLRYRIDATEIVIREGLLFRNERHVPFARIQNIDLVRNPLHRVLGVADVQIETASGAEPEAVLRVLDLAAVEELRARVFAERTVSQGGTEPPAPDTATAVVPRTIVALGTGDLLRLGLNPGRGLAFALVFFGFAWQFDFYDKWNQLEPVLPFLREMPTALLALLTAVLALVILAILLALSVAWVFLRLHGFRLERVGEDFRIACGLLTRSFATVPRKRIQQITVHESPLHRWMGRVSVRFETAGGGGEDNPTPLSRRWFAPLIARRDLPRVLREVFPELDFESLAWRPLAPKARRRMLKRAVLRSLALVVVSLPLFRIFGLLALVVVLPLAVWQAQREARFIAYARPPGGVAYRSGAWYRKTSFAPVERLQVLTLRESPFDRRYTMASLRIATAGTGGAGHRMCIPYLQRAVAQDLHAGLVHDVERRGFEW